MRVLIACEESQAVTIAFRNKGHEAYSCDIQECSGGHSQWHLKGDVFDFLMHGLKLDRATCFWDMLIAFPPCTYLTNAGIGYFNEEKYGDKARQRKMNRADAADFFLKLWEWPVSKICIENPVGYMNHIIKPTQVVHPYMFGDGHKKRTCLWLKGIPPLYHSKESNLFQEKTHADAPPLSIQVRRPGKWAKGGEIKNRYFVDTKSSVSGKQRSKTFLGIALAMAEQWG